jgi:hypothetical protein
MGIPALASCTEHIIARYTGLLRTGFNDQELKIHLIMDNHSVDKKQKSFRFPASTEMYRIGFRFR